MNKNRNTARSATPQAFVSNMITLPFHCTVPL